MQACLHFSEVSIITLIRRGCRVRICSGAIVDDRLHVFGVILPALLAATLDVIKQHKEGAQRHVVLSL